LSPEYDQRIAGYFSTRDLLIMTVLAALGGVSSTYVNTLGDTIHAALGLPGATQWAAGLHVIWIVLGMGILHKPGAGVFIGLLKGTVELFNGNSHGVIILLINLVAGLLVDFGFLLFNKKDTLLPYLIGGSLAAASNVLVFQLFATLPQNSLGISAMIILFAVAFFSGTIFSGVIPYYLVIAMKKAGVSKFPIKTGNNKKIGWWIVSGVFLITILLTGYLWMTYQGPPAVQIGGNVKNSYAFPEKDFSLDKVSRQMNYKNLLTEFDGYPLNTIVEYAIPDPSTNTILLEASDGYAFLISLSELNANEDILLVEKGSGKNLSYDIVGPESSKAWVRNVTNISIISSEGITIVDQDEHIHEFNPVEWQHEMDSAEINLPGGQTKVQGVPVYKIIESIADGFQPSHITLGSENELSEYPWVNLQDNIDIRIYMFIDDESITFFLAKESGEVLLFPLDKIKID